MQSNKNTNNENTPTLSLEFWRKSIKSELDSGHSQKESCQVRNNPNKKKCID